MPEGMKNHGLPFEDPLYEAQAGYFSAGHTDSALFTEELRTGVKNS